MRRWASAPFHRVWIRARPSARAHVEGSKRQHQGFPVTVTVSQSKCFDPFFRFADSPFHTPSLRLPRSSSRAPRETPRRPQTPAPTRGRTQFQSLLEVLDLVLNRTPPPSSKSKLVALRPSQAPSLLQPNLEPSPSRELRRIIGLECALALCARSGVLV
ncbi:hypothetical protein NL676_027106 [Syzygium grande]|nr:hypothetical protein NL676_027106 [Syzygium grande]